MSEVLGKIKVLGNTIQVSDKFSKRELRLKRAKLRGNKCHFRNEIKKQINNNNDDNN